jgi:hypothetical protein
MLFSSSFLVTLKFAAGRQVCRPSHAEFGLKDWAISTRLGTIGALCRQAVPTIGGYNGHNGGYPRLVYDSL